MIYAYTSFNLGDDLFIKELCSRYPQVQFTLYCPRDYKYNYPNLNNLKLVSSDNFFIKLTNFLLNKLRSTYRVQDIHSKKYKTIIYIGGSIFMERSNSYINIKRKKSLIDSKRNIYVIGANFGPYVTKKYYEEHRRLFKNYKSVSFRDQYSYNLFKDLPNVTLADDVIFQMDTKQYQADIEDDYIVISVIKPSIRKHLEGYDEIYYEKIKDISIEFAKKGHKVILMSFCEREGDVEAINSVKSLIPEKYKDYIEEYKYKHDIDGALNIIAQSKYVVATRFHAMILGWVFKKPVFPIAYSDKMTNVIKDIDFKGSYVDFHSLKSLNPKLVYDSMETNTVDISEQRAGAEKHFAKLDDYLKKK